MAKKTFICTLFMPMAFTITSAQNKQLMKSQPDTDYNKSSAILFEDKFLFGQTALDYWIEAYNYRSNNENAQKKRPKIQLIESGDPLQVNLANAEIQTLCNQILADPVDWQKKNQQDKDINILIELAIEFPAQITQATLQLIKSTLLALNISGDNAGYTKWMTSVGSNGSNIHGYLTPLVLAPNLINDQAVKLAGEQSVKNELTYMNSTGDMNEYNLLESHWNGTQSWEIIKKYAPDDKVKRMARLIAERLWINRFLTWSASIQRITGPGSRMAPNEWLGSDDERALIATGMSKPIWLNFFFNWDNWNSRTFHTHDEEERTQAMIPDIPLYLQDLAWEKSLPNLMESDVNYKNYRPYPLLPESANTKLSSPFKYVNYQATNYTIGSATASWVLSRPTISASAWWNSSRSPDAPVGSPKRFCVLYPHYVYNGLSTLDTGSMFFEDNPNTPVRDDKGGPKGPWFREFMDFGRLGSIQDKNTLILSYSPRAGTSSKGEDLVKTKTMRASAAMFLFRWKDGLDGLYINRTPVTKLPTQLLPGDWWFIEDGDVYCAILPLKSTALKGKCKITLEKRNHHIVLYQDNVNDDNIVDISDQDWINARSGFIVELGNKSEYGTFADFQQKMLAANVAVDNSSGFSRDIDYRRGSKELEMVWNCYSEEYAKRKINGVDDQWVKFLKSPEFVVSDSGIVDVKDATVKTEKGNTLWLLSCPVSKTWVTYQANPDLILPINFTCPAGQFVADKFSLGKVVINQTPDNVINISLDENYDIRNLNATYQIQLNKQPKNLVFTINGVNVKPESVKANGKFSFVVHPNTNN